MIQRPTVEQRLVEGATAHVLFCGGFHSSMKGTKASHLLALCEARHLSYTRFDYRGHGASPGDADRLHLGDWLDDTLWVLDRCDGPLIVIGSSMGAWLAVLGARERPGRPSALVLMAAAPDFITELLWNGLTDDQKARVARGEIVRRKNDYDDTLWPLHQDLFDSGRRLSVLGTETLEPIDCPVRLLHGIADADVPWRQSLRLMEALPKADASLLLLPHADHRLSDERSLAALERTLDEVLLRVQSCPRTDRESR